MRGRVDDRVVGALIRELRHELGLNQQGVAKLLRKPQSLVSKLETGERRLSVSELGQIADALGTTPGKLVARIFDS